METNNPELQERLQELEHELEVSQVFATGEMFWVSSRARVGLCYDTSAIWRMDSNL
jgi:hypothetical protein